MNKKIKIAICDDEEKNINELLGYIKKYSDVEIYTYTEPMQILEADEMFVPD